MKDRILGVLGRKLLVYFLAISLIPALLLGYINYIHSKRLLETELFNELSLIGEALTEHINEFLQNGKNSAKHFSSDGFIRDYLEKILISPKNTTIPRQLCAYLEYKTKLEPRFRETFTLSPQGIVVASSNTKRMGMNLSKDIEPWKNTGNAFVKDAHFCEITHEYSLTFYSPVRHKDKDTLLGFIGIRILASELESITVGKKQGTIIASDNQPLPAENGEKEHIASPDEHPADKPSVVETKNHPQEKTHKIRTPTELTTLTRRGNTSESFLVNKEKYMLTASRFIDNVHLKQLVDSTPVNIMLNEGAEIAGIYRDYRDVPVIGVSKYIKEMGWTLIVKTDLSEGLKPVYRVRNYSLSIILAGVFIIPAAAFFVSRKITNPIKLLTSKTGKIAKGESVSPIKILSNDEIGELAKAFNRMAIDLMVARSELRDLFDGANDPMVTLKNDNTINNINSRVSEIFGYTPENLFNKKITNIIRSDDIPRVEESLAKTWLLNPGEKLPTLEICVIGVNGNIFVCELDLNRTRFGIQPHFRNITEKKLLEQTILNEKGKLEESNTQLQALLKELEKTQLQLFQSEKMASIGQLAAGITHEINNPVGYISSNLELTQSKFNVIKAFLTKTNTSKTLEKETVCITKSVADSLEGIKRIKEIINALRTFSYRGDDKLEPVNINAEIDNILQILWNELKYKSNLIKDYGSIPEILCNRYQLGQAFINIILNAIQAIKEKGEIKIATYRDGMDICVEISDNGIGIPPQNLSKIFEPFFTTKEVGKGTGLGLSITYNIIKNHQGTIHVSSKVNEGSIFIIKIPINRL